MKNVAKYAISLAGAGALVSGVLTGAFASSPLRDAFRTQTVNSNLTVKGVLHANKNETVYGNFYTKGKADIYKGALIRANGLNVKAGGIKTDALSVAGQFSAGSGVVTGALQVQQNLQAQALNLSGDAAVGGTLTVGGHLSSAGLDAGGGSITTTGALTAGSVTAASIADAGNLSARDLTVTHGITFGSGTTVDFTGATVTGLPTSLPSNLTALTVGNSSSTSAPLTITQGTKSATLGVNGSGDLTTASLTTTGNVGVGGTLTAANISAPLTGTTPAPGALTLTGSTITLTGDAAVTGTTSLNGDTTLAAGHDLIMSTTGSGGTGSATHIRANGDGDVAGTAGVALHAVAIPTGGFTQSIVFAQTYSVLPIVVVTPTNDPDPAAPAPKYWVTVDGTSGNYTGFTIHYVPGLAPSGDSTANFDYHVFAS